MKVMSTAGATSSQRSIALDAFKRHLAEWQGDRALALKLKDHASVANRDVVYQCDDKCGSQWLTLPTNPAGRDNKATTKHKFKFCVQCNVVVGGGGVNHRAQTCAEGADRTVDNVQYGKWDCDVYTNKYIEDIKTWLLDTDAVPTEWEPLVRIRQQHAA